MIFPFDPESIIEGSVESGSVLTATVHEVSIDAIELELMIERWRRESEDVWIVESGLQAIDLTRAAAAKLLPILQQFLATTVTEGNGSLVPEPKLEPIDPDDAHMTWEDFLDSCESGSFIDYDGFGELATATHVSEIQVSPSSALRSTYKRPAWSTHVVWYNK